MFVSNFHIQATVRLHTQSIPFADRLSPHCKEHPGGAKCYIDTYSAKMNLRDARKACARIGAKLPTILDYRDVVYLKDVFADKSGE